MTGSGCIGWLGDSLMAGYRGGRAMQAKGFLLFGESRQNFWAWMGDLSLDALPY